MTLDQRLAVLKRQQEVKDRARNAILTAPNRIRESVSTRNIKVMIISNVTRD